MFGEIVGGAAFLFVLFGGWIATAYLIIKKK